LNSCIRRLLLLHARLSRLPLPSIIIRLATSVMRLLRLLLS
jgi:hypothetical protein